MIRLKDILEGVLKEEKEWIIWGIPPNKREEEILFTKSKSSGEAKKVADLLTKKYGCKSVRVQTLDISKPADFAKDFGQTLKEEKEFLCEDCWKGYTAVGVKKKGNKYVPNCVPKNEDINLPMLQKPTKPKKAKISKPRFGGAKPEETQRDRIRRATTKLDISKKNLSVARTPRQKTQIQRRIQKQQQRLTKLKSNVTKKTP